MLKPQIEFKHVLGELSVNRNDPCEVLRELISNSYDAEAKNILYAPLEEHDGLIFFDDGIGLSPKNKKNGITPWEAFFSIGKSTKKKGDAIGYKCQGTKLYFACKRILVASKVEHVSGKWFIKIIDNPRNNLDTNYDITPSEITDINGRIKEFYPSGSSGTSAALDYLQLTLGRIIADGTGTLIIIDGLDTESFRKYFPLKVKSEESYVYNYIRFYTRHGDVRYLSKKQGFSPNNIQQVSAKLKGLEFTIYANKKSKSVPFGYPYPNTDDSDPGVKLPSQISRLRDGRFFSRASKSFSIGSSKYSIIMAIDGNRRAHEEYNNLDRKGKAKSGIRLGDHRGLFISVKGIKICKYPDLLASITEYKILAEGDSPSHYTIIIDGDFDLVTNRNSLSKKAFDTLCDTNFTKEVEKFLDGQKKTDKVFAELLSRLKKESTENALNDQISILDNSRNNLKQRERFRLSGSGEKLQLFLSPQAGEEYSVGVLYAVLGNLVPLTSPFIDFWKRIVTFST